MSSHSITEPSPATSFLSDFHSVSEADVQKIIQRSSAKSCILDPIPRWLLKDCLTVLLPMITNIINLSLSQCEMPESFKEAILIPPLKKILLDPEILKHFRPISNLSYVSKLIEMVVDDQVTVYMDENHQHELFQSAYKKFHSTETAMVRIKNDLLSALDDGNAMLVVCLDLSAAFDTVNHEILFTRLEKRIGITGNCVAWFRSYLSNRSQNVLINDVTSSARELSYCVPLFWVPNSSMYIHCHLEISCVRMGLLFIFMLIMITCIWHVNHWVYLLLLFLWNHSHLIFGVG